MAISLKYCIANKTDCKNIAMTDTTGVYASDNVGGYGSPNAEIADVASATLTLSVRNSDGTYTELNVVDLYPTLPNIDGTAYVLTSVDFGYAAGETIPDAIYYGVYEIKDAGDVSLGTKEKTFVQKCAIDCCYKKLSDKAAKETCGKDTKQRFSEMSILMRGLDAALECGDLITITNIMEYLRKFCGNCGCGCS